MFLFWRRVSPLEDVPGSHHSRSSSDSYLSKFESKSSKRESLASRTSSKKNSLSSRKGPDEEVLTNNLITLQSGLDSDCQTELGPDAKSDDHANSSNSPRAGSWESDNVEVVNHSTQSSEKSDRVLLSPTNSNNTSFDDQA